MKNLNNTANLINPILPQEYIACLKWYNRSCFFIFCIIVLLGCYTSYQYWQVSLFKKQYTLQPQPTHDQSDSKVLDKQLLSLQKKVDLLQSIKAKKSLFNKEFKSLLLAIPDDICLSSFEFAHERFIEISGRGRSLSVITNFLQKVQDKPAIAHLMVSKLQPSLDVENREYIHFILH